jgi:MOSC domain-containing protein YiiM
MKILSVNTGKPTCYTFDGTTLETSMVRTPQPKIEVQFRQVVGDVFASPHVHGIPETVVYAFSVDHYTYWSKYLGYHVGRGFFGENLSVDTLLESNFFLGDEYAAGTCLLKATSPRYPCNRLNFVSQNKNTRDHFAEKAQPGVYFQVLREGTIAPGDTLVLNNRIQDKLTLLDIFNSLYKAEKKMPLDDKISQVLESPLVMDRYKVRLRAQYLAKG